MNRKIIAIIASVLVCLMALAACAPAVHIPVRSVPFVDRAPAHLFN